MIDIWGRTFGMELEFGDVNKDQVQLPEGWKWSPDERSIVNSDSTKSTPSGKYGGELNTRPLTYSMEGLREVKSVIDKCFDAGGTLMWNTGFDGHIYIGDLELEDLKKIFALGFYVSPLINEVFDLGGWFNVEHLVPTPTYEFNERVQACETIEALKNVFANSSNRGHYRFQINIMPYFKTKTLEFRIFNSTANFRETMESIRFMYRFLEYALQTDLNDFKKISSVEDFKREFHVKHNFARKIPPMIFAESHKEATRNISKAIPASRKIISAIMLNTKDKVRIVNPFYYQAELAMYKDKSLTIYNSLEFNHIVYLIANEELTVSYENHFEILNQYKDESPQTELTLFLIFARIQKYNMDTEYGINEFMAYIACIDESVAKMKASSDAMVELLTTAEYKVGTLQDALEDAIVEPSEVVFQQEFNSKASSAVTALRKNSSYESDFSRKTMRYGCVDEYLDNTTLMIISRNDYLPYIKVAKDLEVTLYSNKDCYAGVRQVVDDAPNIAVKEPSDDFVIDMDTKIKINEVRPTFFGQLQRKYVKKVTKFSQPKICYTITSGDIVLGAFGFDYVKGENEYDLFLLSDFCTNNDVRLLSKFILFIIKTKEAKRMMERKLVDRVHRGYTKVYTTRPVSMKYRGAFNKVKELSDGRSLVYDCEFGSMGTIEDAKREYMKRTK